MADRYYEFRALESRLQAQADTFGKFVPTPEGEKHFHRWLDVDDRFGTLTVRMEVYPPFADGQTIREFSVHDEPYAAERTLSNWVEDNRDEHRAIVANALTELAVAVPEQAA